MTSLGKALAARKGKAAAKVSVDTALQNFSASDVSATDKLIQDIEAINVVVSDEWGVDESEKDNTSAANAAGHFHLISEEDVQKKQTNKVARKWGGGSNPDEQQAVEQQIVMTEDPISVKEEPGKAAMEPYRPQKYVARARRQPLPAKVDIQDSTSFPGFETTNEELLPPSNTSSSAVETLPLHPPAAPAAAVNTSADSSSASSTEERKKKDMVELKINDDIQSPKVMEIEYFLKDVVSNYKLITNVAPYDDSKTKQKFIGRLKHPKVDIPELAIISS